jgi:hypothetical protein
MAGHRTGWRRRAGGGQHRLPRRIVILFAAVITAAAAALVAVLVLLVHQPAGTPHSRRVTTPAAAPATGTRHTMSRVPRVPAAGPPPGHAAAPPAR